MQATESIVYDYAWKGFVYGLGATIVMTIVMFTGMQTGISPIPEPIPIALTKLVFGKMSKPALVIIGLILHLGYGAVNGALVAGIFKSKSGFWHGIAWGFLLWVVMQLIFLPILGWGAFGTAITFKIAIATFVLHLVYGAALGWGLTKL